VTACDEGVAPADRCHRTDKRPRVDLTAKAAREKNSSRARGTLKLASKGPFVEVNCARFRKNSSSPNFSAHKGSFTGASEDKGKISVRRRRHAFLDEVGDMSLRTQAKVCACWKNSDSSRLDPSNLARGRFASVAATTKTSTRKFARGAFPGSFYPNVIPFSYPRTASQIRTRQTIPPPSFSVRHFLNEFSSEYGKKTRELSENALEILMRYPWPRQRARAAQSVERLVIVCPKRVSSRTIFLPTFPRRI